MKIAITGLSASGKGAVSRLVATKARLYYFDLGMIFRSVAWTVKELSTNFKECEEESKHLSFLWDGREFHAKYKDRDITLLLGNKEVSSTTSELASKREWMDLMKSLVERKIDGVDDVIVDGRNAGLSVLPHADYIFYIDTLLKTRALRRASQLKLPFKEVMDDLWKRDKRDAEREYDPFIIPERSIIVPNNEDLDKCVSFILRRIG